MVLSWSWLRDARLLVLFAGLVVIGVGIAGSEHGQPTCSAADPCRPSALGSICLGLLLGSMVALYLHRRAAAWLAAGTAAAFVAADLLDPIMPWWAYLAFLGYAALCWYLPGAEAAPAGRPAAAAGAPVTGHQPVRRPAQVPLLGRGWLVAAAVLAAAGTAAAWWGLAEQDRKDAQQQAAPVVAGVVREHRDDFTVRVRLDDGRTVDVAVLDAVDYPVGDRMRFYVDGRGLTQPVSEPYDATGWLSLAALAGGVAATAALRTVDRNAALRRLFDEAQPVRAVDAVEGWRDVHLFLPGTRPGRATVARVPMVLAGPPAAEDDEDGEDWDGYEQAAAGGPVPALLYGDPRPGRWCAVQVGDRVRLPRGPVRSVQDVPFDPVTGEHPSVADEPPVDRALLIDADRQAAPADLRTHRMHPLAGWVRTVAVAVQLLAAGLVVARPLAPLSYLEALAVTALLAAAGLAYGWRRHLRPYLCWNAGGLVAVLPWRIVRIDWSAWSHVDEAGAEVSVLDEDSGQEITARARPRMRLLPAAPGERSAEQLGHALRYAREQALRGGEAVAPPVVAPPHPPLRYLVACWAVLAPATAAALGWVVD